MLSWGAGSDLSDLSDLSDPNLLRSANLQPPLNTPALFLSITRPPLPNKTKSNSGKNYEAKNRTHGKRSRAGAVSTGNSNFCSRRHKGSHHHGRRQMWQMQPERD